MACYSASVQTPQSRKEIALKLARHHFEVEPRIELVLFLEVEPNDTITLLEVSNSTPASGSVDAFVFAPTQAIPYVTRIAEVTPTEYKQLRQDPSRLPPGWNLAKATIFKRATFEGAAS